MDFEPRPLVGVHSFGGLSMSLGGLPMKSPGAPAGYRQASIPTPSQQAGVFLWLKRALDCAGWASLTPCAGSNVEQSMAFMAPIVAVACEVTRQAGFR